MLRINGYDGKNLDLTCEDCGNHTFLQPIKELVEDIDSDFVEKIMVRCDWCGQRNHIRFLKVHSETAGKQLLSKFIDLSGEDL